MTKRRRFTADFKARVALDALHGGKTIQEIAARHKVHPNQVSTWKRQAVDGLGAVFSNGADSAGRDHETEVRDLHCKIGELTVERDPGSRPGQAFWPEGSSDEPERPQGDHRPHPPWPELGPSMPSALDQPLVLLLRAEGREPGEPGADAPHRWAIPEVSFLRLPPNGPAFAPRRLLRRPSSGSPVDAPHGFGSDLPGAENQRAPSGTPDLSLSAQGHGRVIGEWIDFYNTERPHSALAGTTPAEAYGAGRPVYMMDKASALPTSPPAQQQHKDVINKDLAA